jgi:general stress protein 26
MGRLPAEPGEQALTVRFLADGRSRKAAEIRRCGKVTAIYEHQPSDGYVTVTGAATLQDDPSVVCRRWKRGYEAYFPTEADRAHALFVEVEIERLELWIRGVTPEPFGMKPTVLEREGEGWRVVGS